MRSHIHGRRILPRRVFVLKWVPGKWGSPYSRVRHTLRDERQCRAAKEGVQRRGDLLRCRKPCESPKIVVSNRWEKAAILLSLPADAEFHFFGLTGIIRSNRMGSISAHAGCPICGFCTAFNASSKSSCFVFKRGSCDIFACVCPMGCLYCE